MKNQMIELAEGIISELELDTSMETFYGVSNFVMDNWEGCCTSLPDIVREYKKIH